jgi:hypothetical protein
MIFKENKKRERFNRENDQEIVQAKKKPAWIDSNTQSLIVNIDNGASRLRKLK